jgi:hypothetical protein
MDTSMGGVPTWLRGEAHLGFMDALAPVCSPAPILTLVLAQQAQVRYA